MKEGKNSLTWRHSLRTMCLKLCQRPLSKKYGKWWTTLSKVGLLDLPWQRVEEGINRLRQVGLLEQVHEVKRLTRGLYIMGGPREHHQVPWLSEMCWWLWNQNYLWGQYWSSSADHLWACNVTADNGTAKKQRREAWGPQLPLIPAKSEEQWRPCDI